MNTASTDSMKNTQHHAEKEHKEGMVFENLLHLTEHSKHGKNDQQKCFELVVISESRDGSR